MSPALCNLDKFELFILLPQFPELLSQACTTQPSFKIDFLLAGVQREKVSATLKETLLISGVLVLLGKPRCSFFRG